MTFSTSAKGAASVSLARGLRARLVTSQVAQNGDMIAFWSDHVAILLQRALSVVKPDCVHLSEDMAYKSFSMISPARLPGARAARRAWRGGCCAACATLLM